MSRTLRLVAANTDFNRPGDPRYLPVLRDLAGPNGVLCTSERVHGPLGTQIDAVGAVDVEQMARWEVGDIGAHRWVARADVTLRPAAFTLRVWSIHALHVKTSGKAAQADYFEALAERTHRLTELGRPWAVLGDFNRPLVSAARLLGGQASGTGIDGAVLHPDLTIVSAGVSRVGLRSGWTDHPATWTAIRVGGAGL